MDGGGEVEESDEGVSQTEFNYWKEDVGEGYSPIVEVELLTKADMGEVVFGRLLSGSMKPLNSCKWGRLGSGWLKFPNFRWIKEGGRRSTSRLNGSPNVGWIRPVGELSSEELKRSPKVRWVRKERSKLLACWLKQSPKAIRESLWLASFTVVD